jgi:hypothetical protein
MFTIFLAAKKAMWSSLCLSTLFENVLSAQAAVSYLWKHHIAFAVSGQHMVSHVMLLWVTGIQKHSPFLL